MVKEKDWLSEDLRTDGRLKIKVHEMNSLIRTEGCWRRVLSQCLNNNTQDCN